MTPKSEISRFIQTAIPYAPHAQLLAEAIVNGTNVAYSTAERRALRRMAKIEGSRENRIEFVATQIVVNASQAARNPGSGAIDCARNGVEDLIRLTRS